MSEGRQGEKRKIQYVGKVVSLVKIMERCVFIHFVDCVWVHDHGSRRGIHT